MSFPENDFQLTGDRGKTGCFRKQMSSRSMSTGSGGGFSGLQCWSRLTRNGFSSHLSESPSRSDLPDGRCWVRVRVGPAGRTQDSSCESRALLPTGRTRSCEGPLSAPAASLAWTVTRSSRVALPRCPHRPPWVQPRPSCPRLLEPRASSRGHPGAFLSSSDPLLL